MSGFTEITRYERRNTGRGDGRSPDTGGGDRTFGGGAAALKMCPVELWGHIFELCFNPICAPLETKAGETDKHPLFTIVQVCSSWRTVALHTPNLWRNIYAHNDERGLTLATKWFSRAGSAPISITLLTSGGSMVGFQQLIAQYRFQTISIESVETETIELVDFAQIPVESLQPLEALLLDLRYDPTARTSVPAPRLSRHSLPNLRCLCIGPYVEMPQFHIPNPFMTWHLRFLYLSCPLPVSECISILRHCQNPLQECSMRVLGSLPDEDNPEFIRLRFPKLRRLTLLFDDAIDSGNFLDLITLPRATSLMITGRCRDSADRPSSCTHETIEQLVSRSQIQRLEEIYVPISRLDVGRMLQLLPFLRKLMIKWIPLLDAQVAQNIGEGTIGTRLQAIIIQRPIRNFEIDKFLSMIESRERTCREKEGISRITTIGFKFRETAPGREGFEKRVDNLKQLGIIAVVSWVAMRPVGA